MPTILSVANDITVDLTPGGMAAAGIPPIIAGDCRELRIQWRDSFGAIDLTGANLYLETDSGFVRSTANQMIATDADQSVENVTNKTGKGWTTIRFLTPDANAMIAAPKAMSFDYRARFGEGTVETRMRGKIGFMKPVGRTAEG